MNLDVSASEARAPVGRATAIQVRSKRRKEHKDRQGPKKRGFNRVLHGPDVNGGGGVRVAEEPTVCSGLDPFGRPAPA